MHNDRMTACMNEVEGVNVPCDHRYCWDAEQCTETKYEERRVNDCKWKTINAKQDKCLTCNLIFTYP